MSLTDRMILAPDVSQALAKGGAVVALESTIITHGMPYPQNLETARAVEGEVRAKGAVPATIALIDGALHIGLTAAQLDHLAQAKGAAKVSRADFAWALAANLTGGTTVAATMIAAHAAGIAVFATGGIGGVHQGAETSFDISADLLELARTPVAVVCAGAKAILDIPKTLEVLETQGVPVIAYQSDAFPAFWSRDAGLPAPLRADTPLALAQAFHLHRQMPNAGGLLVANPIPQANEIPAARLRPLIDQAQAEAQQQGISGKAVTPFLLQRLFEMTQGASLGANIALVRNNARLAAEFAQALGRGA